MENDLLECHQVSPLGQPWSSSQMTEESEVEELEPEKRLARPARTFFGVLGASLMS
jgi:hypothetical protein